MKKVYPTDNDTLAYWIIAGWLAAMSAVAAIAV